VRWFARIPISDLPARLASGFDVRQQAIRHASGRVATDRGDQQNDTDVQVQIEGTTMTVKLLVTGVAAVASSGASALQVRPVVLSAPLDPPPPPPPGAPALPSPEQLSSLCNQLTDAGVSYTTKLNLVQGGISPDEGHVADHDLRKAFRDGNFPEQFNVTNIQPAGPNAASAEVAITGPKFAGPVSKPLVFVNEGGNWIFQHEAALALVQAATATN
jgi:hypothetical protein